MKIAPSNISPIKISIVTVCFNSAQTIADCIQSIKCQNHKNIEHIIIDGGSSDGTLEIIKKLSPEAIIVSEKDAGIYDAMNKGYHLATGDIIGILNSDDFFLNPTVLSTIVTHFVKNNLDCLCGRINFFNVNGKVFSHIFGAEPNLQKNLHRMCMAHPTVYTKREIINAVGLYNLNYTVAADFDWCIRLLSKNLKWGYIHEPMIGMRLGGMSSKRNYLAAIEEFRIKKHYFPHDRIKFTFNFFKILSLITLRNILFSFKLTRVIHLIRTIQHKTK